jgi:hypothetical protein
LRPARQGISTLAGLDLGELARDLESLGLGKRYKRFALRLNARTGAPLPLGRDAMVGDQGGSGVAENVARGPRSTLEFDDGNVNSCEIRN